MRSEHEIRTDIAAAKAAYLAMVGTAPADGVRAGSQAVKDLQGELAARLSAGAVACPVCAVAPHGMLRRPGVYEVGCLDGHRMAQGATVEEAVARWNADAAVPV